ncbi:uncharacterized protein N7484_000214 [Penicillium longicatenatum]|uniref:uncharacterized protein n=1 Tax=Penicillium longicatenatum TaxID=1561947 RepID=UPI0025484683|nr:uncharacterized protein N7484_000214 [Penicillium longicatenatum]KAJ5660842.1 hypothetical protein N7484_000214 [Penicillium longicatenatum]
MDFDEEQDPMLKEAIEASLRDDSGNTGPFLPSQAPRNVVDLTYDSDDQSDVKEVFPKSNSVVESDSDEEAEQGMHDDEAELRRAIAMSLQDLQSEVEPVEPGLLGLNRKRMEQERLARIQKRKARESASPPGQPQAKLYKTEPISTGTPSVSHAKPSSPSSSSKDSIARIRPTARLALQWPLGTVKKTHVANTIRGDNEITIEEVIQRGDLELGIFSSFLWDMEWFFTKCDTWRTRFLLIMHAKEQEMRDSMLEDTKDMKNIRLCFPPMDGQVNTMHSKLMILFHPEYVRIAVPTANLTMTDWGEDRLMENTVFLIDLPKNEPGLSSPNTFFYEELTHFLKASTVNERILAKLAGYDFTETARYAFVHTIGGTSGPTNETWRRTGYCGLGRAVKQLGLRTSSPINVDYVASSIGSLNNEFLRAIYLACKGDDGLADYTLRYDKSKSHAPNPDQLMMNSSEEWKDRLLVYFPSDDTVHGAHDSPEQTAGTVCFQSKWWRGPKFPKQVMRDCISKKAVLMHNKLLYVWPSEPIVLPNNRICKGWAYVGSANMSESAWGRLVKDRQTNKAKLNCRNWECGVLVPVETSVQQNAQDAKSQTQPKHLPTEIFEDTIPIPMMVPAPPLDERNKPWFFMGD